jgi:hypothetical protein
VYEHLPSFILGFHGCDSRLAARVIAGKSGLKASENDYDWLGHGIYFWEHNPSRGLQYAGEVLARRARGGKRVGSPAVIGAIIDPGRCLNLLDSSSLRLVKRGFAKLKALMDETGERLPENRPLGASSDLLLRRLDCAVIETVHKLLEDEQQPAFQTVRGVFIEGKPLYPTAGFHERSHIQICVRDPQCIQGYFRVLK